MTLWIARVRADDAYGVASVRPAPNNWRASPPDAPEFIVAAENEVKAEAVARRILERARARARLASADASERKGYAQALDDLASFLDEQRCRTPDRPSGQYAGVTEGRLDILESLERWALAMRPKGL